MKLKEKASAWCIKVADGFSHPLAIALFPMVCLAYLVVGGIVDDLTLILSILAISLTQMVLRAQNVDAEQSKLQMAELVKSSPDARDVVIREDLTDDQIKELKKEINDAVSEEL